MVENENLVGEIKRTNRLLALLLTKDKKGDEAISVLNSAGFRPKEIAEIMETTSNTVSVTLSKMKAKRKKTIKSNKKKR